MKVGFIGGKFLPLHMGHVYSIIQASNYCDKLYVILSHSKKRDEKLCEEGNIKYIPPVIRLRWLCNLCDDMENVEVIDVEDEYDSDENYNWQEGANQIKNKIGEEINYVFSSEKAYTSIFKELYPKAEHIIIDVDKKTYDISGTRIRNEGVFKHWNYLPDFVKPYFVKKVVIIGTESCGKSTLIKNLAKIYNTSYVSEYGREFAEKYCGKDKGLTAEDFPIIAYGHKIKEFKAIQKANKIVFIDTESITTKFYSEVYTNESQIIFDEMAKLQKYDLFIYLEPDVKWKSDGFRIFGDQEIREQNNKKMKSMFEKNNIEFITIKGSYSERFKKSKRLIDQMINENSISNFGERI